MNRSRWFIGLLLGMLYVQADGLRSACLKIRAKGK